MLEKLTNCLLLLACGLLILFNPTISKAQNKSALCESGFEKRWGYKYVLKTNLFTYKSEYVYDYVYDCFPIETGNKSVTSNGENSATRNSKSTVLSEIRLSDSIGIWEGFYEKVACILKIEKVEGENFYGVLERQGTSVAITGTINTKARSINFSPTKIVTMDNSRDWRLGFNWGDFSDDGKSILGKGTGNLTNYDWNFVKKATGSSSGTLRPETEPNQNNSKYGVDISELLTNSSIILTGNWKGTYSCGQSSTNLNLKISQITSSKIGAVFEFFANRNNPSIPSGSFNMIGTFDSKTNKIKLRATNWINQPTGYVTVDLDGTVTQGNTKISGEVLDSACSTFALERK